MLYLLEELLPNTTHLNLEVISWAASVSNNTIKYNNNDKHLNLSWLYLPAILIPNTTPLSPRHSLPRCIFLKLHYRIQPMGGFASSFRAVSFCNYTIKYTTYRAISCIEFTISSRVIKILSLRPYSRPEKYLIA